VTDAIGVIESTTMPFPITALSAPNAERFRIRSHHPTEKVQWQISVFPFFGNRMWKSATEREQLKKRRHFPARPDIALNA
jgi:hypothetical protein